jgi:hypothetical protein
MTTHGTQRFCPCFGKLTLTIQEFKINPDAKVDARI